MYQGSIKVDHVPIIDSTTTSVIPTSKMVSPGSKTAGPDSKTAVSTSKTVDSVVSSPQFILKRRYNKRLH